MISRTFFFWTPQPPWSEKPLFSVVVYYNYQYLHQAVFRFMGEHSQIWLCLVLIIAKRGWWVQELAARSCICFGHSNHYVAQIYTYHYVIISNRLCPHILNWTGVYNQVVRWSHQCIQTQRHKGESLKEKFFRIIPFIVCCLHVCMPLSELYQ